MLYPEVDDRETGDGRKWAVYFAISSCGRCLKIGSSLKPHIRIRDLCAIGRIRFGLEEMEYIGVILATPRYEEALHEHFRAFKIYPRSEWYHPAPEIMEYIGMISDRFVAVSDFYKNSVT